MGLTRGFRAVSIEEYDEILATGEFKVGPNSMEGKWFADTLDGAIAHGNALYPDQNFKLVSAELPDSAQLCSKKRISMGKGQDDT